MSDRPMPEDERAVQLMVGRIVGKGPREIIARAVGGGPAYYSLADLILDRLRAAGYQIVKTAADALPTTHKEP